MSAWATAAAEMDVEGLQSLYLQECQMAGQEPETDYSFWTRSELFEKVLSLHERRLGEDSKRPRDEDRH